MPGKDVEAAGMSVEYLIGKLDLTSLRSLADSMDAEVCVLCLFRLLH